MSAPPGPPFSERYTDAFWRMVTIPLLLVAGVVAVVARPSPVAIAALAVVTCLGLCAELLIWRHLRRCWSRGHAPGSVHLSRGTTVALLFVIWFVLAVSRAYGRAGSWAGAVRIAAAMTAIYAVALLVAWACDRYRERVQRRGP